jgi:hypothetical protein
MGGSKRERTLADSCHGTGSSNRADGQKLVAVAVAVAVARPSIWPSRVGDSEGWGEGQSRPEETTLPSR